MTISSDSILTDELDALLIYQHLKKALAKIRAAIEDASAVHICPARFRYFGISDNSIERIGRRVG